MKSYLWVSSYFKWTKIHELIKIPADIWVFVDCYWFLYLLSCFSEEGNSSFLSWRRPAGEFHRWTPWRNGPTVGQVLTGPSSTFRTRRQRVIPQVEYSRTSSTCGASPEKKEEENVHPEDFPPARRDGWGSDPEMIVKWFRFTQSEMIQIRSDPCSNLIHCKNTKLHQVILV